MMKPENLDLLGARLRRALIMEANRMETRWMIARLRALLDLLEREANHKADQATGLSESVTVASLNSGQSLGLMRAHSLLREVLGDLLRDASRP